MEVISSLDNKKIKNYSKLLQKKYRDTDNLFIVEGEHLVKEAYQSKVLVEVIMCEGYDIDIDVPITYVTYEVIKKLSNTLNPQKIMGICKKIKKKEIGNKVLILDDIQDPGNLGTIIRSCVAFNIETIILSNNSVDLYNDKVIRASEGMIFKVNIIRDDIIKVINNLKDNNYVIYGTKVDGGENIDKVVVAPKYALVMGNEGAGVSTKVLELCDKYLYIPMNSNCESLNVGVATSIILYSLNK